MRIQHNIAALNSYRNLTTNNSAVSKNLEKLSSGYRINRAGDDAAGLAISEKMRAQITGLQTAQKNANDGISLVQTAEGALTEVHSMLNRMVELANQSANGTYQDEVDRENLQKEIVSLTDEIDRISESTNYNGIKLLDGSMNGKVSKVVSDATIVGEENIDVLVSRMGDKMILNGKDNKDYGYFHKDASGSAKTSFSFDLEGRGFTVANDGTAKITVSIEQAQAIPTDAQDEAYTANLEIAATKGKDITTEDIVDAFMKNVGDDGTIMLKVGKDSAGTADAEIEYKVTKGADGHSLNFEMTDEGWTTAAKIATDKAAAAKEANKTAADADKKSENPADYMSAFQASFNFSAMATAGTPAAGDATITKVDLPDIGSSKPVIGTVNAGLQRAETMLRFVDGDTDKAVAKNTVKDGAGLKVGDTYYVWGGSDKTVNGEYGDKVKVIDIRDLVDEDGVLDTSDLDTPNDKLTVALTRLAEAAKDNEIFSVQVPANGDALVFTERIGYDGDADLTTAKGFQEQIRSFTEIHENVETKAATGKDLTLQVGDTSDDFNQLKVTVGSMSSKALGIGSIDISTQAGAAAAVDKIKNAINLVSSTRGDLGAVQNRLEHTINNLSVTKENITAAESRIRDVDMAEEMMAYTKNNILVQASQAMLAQANQIPQGVLQLLQ